MLLDALLPRFHKHEYHELVVAAMPDELWAALERAELSRPLPIRLLMGLRAIPALFARDAWMRKNMKRRGPLHLRDLQEFGFEPIAEARHEIVFGIEGRFWQPVAEVRPGDRERFAQPMGANTARAIWNFAVEPVDATRSRLSTTTRIECSDAKSLASFRRYWLFVRPFSGLIRILMLGAVRRELEAGRRRSSANMSR